MSVAGYPFLYGLHPTYGYTFIVLPPFLDPRGQGARRLAEALAGDVSPSGTAYWRRLKGITGAEQETVAVYRVLPGTGDLIGRPGGRRLRDDHGREFVVVLGLLCDETTSETSASGDGLTEDDFARLAQECLPAYQWLWQQKAPSEPQASPRVAMMGRGTPLRLMRQPDYIAPRSYFASASKSAPAATNAAPAGDEPRAANSPRRDERADGAPAGPAHGAPHGASPGATRISPVMTIVVTVAAAALIVRLRRRRARSRSTANNANKRRTDHLSRDDER